MLRNKKSGEGQYWSRAASNPSIFFLFHSQRGRVTAEYKAADALAVDDAGRRFVPEETPKARGKYWLEMSVPVTSCPRAPLCQPLALALLISSSGSEPTTKRAS